MLNFLAWGAGQNSSAILALIILKRLKIEPSELCAVFCDTGAEFPATYEYIKTVTQILLQHEIRTIFLSPETHPNLYRKNIEGKNLYDYLFSKGWVPQPRLRLCTYEYKIYPFRQLMKKMTGAGVFYKRYSKLLVGIAGDEKHRIRGKRNKHKLYPLADLSMNRQDCINVIAEAGLPVPTRTGCWCCMLQPKTAWINLANNHPVLFEKCVALENRKIEVHSSGELKLYHKHPLKKMLEIWANKKQKQPENSVKNNFPTTFDNVDQSFFKKT